MDLNTRQLMLGVLISVATLITGCDRWPWETPKAKQPAPSAASPTVPTTSPGSVTVTPQELVATVNHTSISTADIEFATLELKRLMQAYEKEWKPLPTKEVPDSLDLVDVLNNVVDSELKAQDARARGLDTKPEVKQRLAYLQRSFYSQEWDRYQREQAMPTEDEIQKFYDQNKAAFMEPERINVSQSVTATLADAEAARARAIQGEPFASVARELSVGAGKDKGGKIGWHLKALDRERLRLIGGSPTEEVFFPQLEPVAFALEKDQISQPVKGPDGHYYVIQLNERKPSRQETAVEVHDSIRDLLTIQAMQRQLETLQGKAKIDRFPERLENVKQ